MSNVARYLITTADERTWKFDRPVIFLGEWCRLYSRKHVWQDMDAIVAAPYGLGQAQKDLDHTEARALEQKLLPILCALLNSQHRTQHGLRFWRIVLGHWLRRYVDVILNRVRTLEQCLRLYQISGTTGFEFGSYSLATQDSNSAIWAFNDDRWNNELTVRILNEIDYVTSSIEYISECNAKFFQLTTQQQTLTKKQKVLNWGKQFAIRATNQMVRNTDAFIINTYLPKKQTFKLHLALAQFPQVWISPVLKEIINPDIKLRRNLTSEIMQGSKNLLEHTLYAMVFELLPVCYLEGFQSIEELLKEQNWPNKPKFIFTSNNFDTDEVFKRWMANQMEIGTKYFCGQHGNNYGTYRYMMPSVEEVTSDKFITWGWTEDVHKHVPAFIFKTSGITGEKYSPSGGLLLIEVCMNHRITTWDGSVEFNEYFIEQQQFINLLNCSIRNKLTVRLHSGYRFAKWSEESRWKAFDSTLRIDTGSTPISDLVARSRLVIHSYDSTGILETLSQNIPTLAYWQNGFDHLRDSAKPMYQLLVDAGIVHLTHLSIAQKINEVWDDVDTWWTTKKVQEARKAFCKRYAFTSDNPVTDLKKILINQNN